MATFYVCLMKMTLNLTTPTTPLTSNKQGILNTDKKYKLKERQRQVTLQRTEKVQTTALLSDFLRRDADDKNLYHQAKSGIIKLETLTDTQRLLS